MKKWISLLGKGDKVFGKCTGDEYEYIENYSDGGFLTSIKGEKKYLIKKAVDYTKTGLYLIKRLWNEGKLKEVIGLHEEKIYYPDEVKSQIEKYNDLIDIDKTLEEYIKTIQKHKEIIDKTKKINRKMKNDPSLNDDGYFRCEVAFPTAEDIKKKLNNKVIVVDNDWSALDGNEYVTSGGVKVKLNYLKAVKEKSSEGNCDLIIILRVCLDGTEFLEYESIKPFKSTNDCVVNWFIERGLELEFKESAIKLDTLQKLWDFLHHINCNTNDYVFMTKDLGTVSFVDVNKSSDVKRFLSVKQFEEKYNVIVGVDV